MASHEHADCFAFECLADQHELDDVGDLDAADHRATLRHDIDQPLGLQPGKGFRYREAGDAEAFADGSFVEDFPWAQLKRHDCVTERRRDRRRDVAALGRVRFDQKFVRDFRLRHANMLVASGRLSNRPPHILAENKK